MKYTEDFNMFAEYVEFDEEIQHIDELEEENAMYFDVPLPYRPLGS